MLASRLFVAVRDFPIVQWIVLLQTVRNITSCFQEAALPDEIRISMFEVVGGSLCVASSDGQKVYDRLAAALKADWDISLSFHNVTAMTATFLNTAIGQLYGTFSETRIRSRLKVKDIEQDDLVLLQRVVDNAKLYFKNPQRFDQVM